MLQLLMYGSGSVTVKHVIDHSSRWERQPLTKPQHNQLNGLRVTSARQPPRKILF